MKVRLNGNVLQARVDPRYADTERGHAVLVLESGALVEPSFAATRGMTVIAATLRERAALKAAGYELLDDPGVEGEAGMPQ